MHASTSMLMDAATPKAFAFHLGVRFNRHSDSTGRESLQQVGQNCSPKTLSGQNRGNLGLAKATAGNSGYANGDLVLVRRLSTLNEGGQSNEPEKLDERSELSFRCWHLPNPTAWSITASCRLGEALRARSPVARGLLGRGLLSWKALSPCSGGWAKSERHDVARGKATDG